MAVQTRICQKSSPCQKTGGFCQNSIRCPHAHAAVDGYRFNEAADAIYQFVWNSYCDWYIEFIKPGLSEMKNPAVLRVMFCIRFCIFCILHAVYF